RRTCRMASGAEHSSPLAYFSISASRQMSCAGRVAVSALRTGVSCVFMLFFLSHIKIQLHVFDRTTLYPFFKATSCGLRITRAQSWALIQIFQRLGGLARHSHRLGGTPAGGLPVGVGARRTVQVYSISAPRCVADPVDQPGRIVRYRQGAVAEDLQVHGPSPGRFPLQPALRKCLMASDTTGRIQTNERNPVTGFPGPVPGTMLGNEDLVAVFGREHAAGVEAHAERGDVRAKFLRGRLELRAIAVAAEFRVGQIALVAVREAEMHAGARRVVQ